MILVKGGGLLFMDPEEVFTSLSKINLKSQKTQRIRRDWNVLDTVIPSILFLNIFGRPLAGQSWVGGYSQLLNLSYGKWTKNGRFWGKVVGGRKNFSRRSPKSLQNGLWGSPRVPNYFSTLWIDKIRIFEEVMTLFRSKLAQNRPKKGSKSPKKLEPTIATHPTLTGHISVKNFQKGKNDPFLRFPDRAESFAPLSFENSKDIPKKIGQSRPRTFSLFRNRLTLTNFFSSTRFSKSDENVRKMHSSFR